MEEIDLLDRKIITALNANVRAPFSQIAKKVRTSKEVVNYRVKRLQKRDIIRGFVTIFDLGYWSYKFLVQLEKTSGEQEKKIISALTAHSSTTWVTPCTGNWDLVFAMMAKDPAHSAKLFRELIAPFSGNVQDYKMGISIGSDTFGHSYLLGTPRENKWMSKKSIGNITLDEKDKVIAKLLRNDARISLTDISRKTHIPVDTVKYRIKQMEKKQVIKRYRLILEPSRLGFHRYEVFLRCIPLSDALVMKFREYAKSNSHVEYFSRCVGNWDIEMTVHFKTDSELRDFVLEVKKEFWGSIKNFETITLFETQKFVYLPEELE